MGKRLIVFFGTVIIIALFFLVFVLVIYNDKLEISKGIGGSDKPVDFDFLCPPSWTYFTHKISTSYGYFCRESTFLEVRFIESKYLSDNEINETLDSLIEYQSAAGMNSGEILSKTINGKKYVYFDARSANVSNESYLEQGFLICDDKTINILSVYGSLEMPNEIQTILNSIDCKD